jgi:hypothetical protein
VYLETVSIKRFRSVEDCELSGVGGFNVLIGKNNSGKSNILSGIHAFFRCIEGGNVVTLQPPHGGEIDFYRGETKQPIEITLSFSLTPPERDSLIQDIFTEAPQVRNAAEGLDLALRVVVTVAITYIRRPFGYVSRIALESTGQASGRPHPVARTIFEVAALAARELRDRLSEAKQARENADDLRKLPHYIDSDDWERFRGMAGKGADRMPLRAIVRRFAPPSRIGPDVWETLESVVSDSASHQDFRRAIEGLAAEKEKQADAVQQLPLREKVSTFAGEEASVPRYVQNLLHRISDIRVAHFTEKREPVGKGEAQRLLSLKVTRGGPAILKDFQETVSALLGVNIDAFQGEPGPEREGPSAEMDVDNFLVEVNGSGIREALRLVLDVEFEKPQLLLVEEPEIHLHPSLETSVMRYLKRISAERQVFITTHSTNFLDTHEMKNVYLVTKQRSTQAQLLDMTEAEARIPAELGVRLSSVFMYDRLVFVEGPFDEDVIREYASKLGINLSQANVGFLPMRGARNFAHFASSVTLSFLTKRQVRIWLITDRDERDDADIGKLKALVGNTGVAWVLRKREMENYLVCPRAIAAFVKLKRELAGVQQEEALPTEAEVAKAINECCEQLKHVAIERRVAKVLCKPIYPSAERIQCTSGDSTFLERIGREVDGMIRNLEEARLSSEKVIAEQSAIVEGQWASSKVAMVPGDELLDRVCQRFGVRFKKELGDGARLVRLMHVNEIDPEIKELIADVVSS